MLRPCFICQTEVENIYSVSWHLPGLETQQIGISICPKCGSVCQSPSASFQDMMKYYESIVVYTNPGRDEKPSSTKVRDVDEHIQFVKRELCRLPESLLQIGSSDGYTLWRFQEAGVPRVFGVEPGSDSVRLAKQKYGMDCFHGIIEDFSTDESFELILLTHVLEHFFDPCSVLKKCYELQRSLDQGFLFVEVPLLTYPDCLCPGFFSFEHVNYYTRNNLRVSLEEAGYSVIATIEHYNSDASPIIGMIATTRKRRQESEPLAEYHLNKKTVLEFRARELQAWQKCVDQIIPELEKAKRIFLWGAGIHTSQLLADTDLIQKFAIYALLDTSPLKWGMVQGDWLCMNPHQVEWQTGDVVVISSYMSEKEIYDALSWLREKGVATLRLHHVDDTKAQ